MDNLLNKFYNNVQIFYNIFIILYFNKTNMVNICLMNKKEICLYVPIESPLKHKRND